MENKLIVIGNFGKNTGNCGQTIKTNVIFNLLEREYQGDVVAFNTMELRNPFKFLTLSFKVLKYSKFIILPAQRALPFLAFLFYIFNKKADYIVIGGWLPDYLLTARKLIKRSISYNFRLFVETRHMSNKLEKIGLDSHVLPNFKNFKKLDFDRLVEQKIKAGLEKRYVYMSRVIKEKGGLDAINALYEVAKRCKEKSFYFDIYGFLDEKFECEFNNAIEMAQTENLTVVYKGFVSPSEVQDILIQYDFFLFPTYYQGEGFPGCLIDALSAGVPIVASNWKYNSEIVEHKRNGFLYESRNIAQLTEILMYISSLNNADYNNLVNRCLTDSLLYHEENVKITMKDFQIF